MKTKGCGMYRGFNLDMNGFDVARFVEIGRGLHNYNKSLVEERLESFKDRNGNLIASEIIAKWFPLIEADVFLSHSHKDEVKVIGLAGWLKETFGLTSFIDSCIWGYSADLLKIIDDEYCYDKSSATYDYQKRNRSTSHVYMMLSTALAKMINECECVFFVNTPNSISPKSYIENEITDSPWIYSEIAMTSLIQRRVPADHRGPMIKALAALERLAEGVNVKYDINLKHLAPLDADDLKGWARVNASKGSDALDALYSLKG
ncbi:MAG TPA: hypothetical protein VFY35_03795 [Burkholderiaceae bacterium]|nr:hypothetical protein [Burkholderiaceae bacterium]